MPPFAFTLKMPEKPAPKKRTVEKWSAEKLAEQQASEKRAADKKADKEKKAAQRAEEKKRAAQVADPFGDFDFDVDYCPCSSGLYFIGCCLDKNVYS